MRVEVAVPVPVPRTFTYAADAAIAEGTRVRVAFSGRPVVGWVTGPGSEARPAGQLRPIERVLEDEPSVTPELLRLCRWIAAYYVAPLGLVLRAALPAVLSRSSRRSPPVKTQRLLRLTAELPTLTEREEVFGRSHRQRELFEAVEALGGPVAVSQLTRRMGYSHAVIRGLARRGLAVLEDATVLRDPFSSLDAEPPLPVALTPDQRAALDRLLADAAAPNRPFLLLGVTGSGKTQVYIEVLRRIVLEMGRGAIVLVPEISLTPQTVARFRSHFGDVVAVLHSALSDGERYDAWRALRTGDRRIAIGARSAIFAPVADLGAIVVDEEHESSYKQSEMPRYHAREVAVMRAHFAGALCLLGSATPSLESYDNARAGKFELLRLPVRVEGRPLPPVRVIDLREAPRPVRTGRGVLTAELADAVADRLRRGEQTILLLNRRGYATFVQCRDCGHVWRCARCSVSLTFHRGRRRLVCHYCFHEEATPVVCPACGSADLSFLGAGTEQVEREVAERFPTARIARMDVDTTSAKWSHHEILGRVERAEVDILLGTQMIAKGLDYPGVTLVGVINADVAMNLPDFRASERTFQLLTQVAGRAGRGPAGGLVLVQTSLPGHYAIENSARHDYEGFAARELEERRGPDYPPHCRLANVVISGTAESAVRTAAEAAAAWLGKGLDQEGPAGVRLTGPAPCPVEKVRGRWRWHFLLRSARSRALGVACRTLQREYELRAGRADLRLVIDRDPVTLL
ncbi:MAG: primosomal protein N' [Gemmatimonadota bacterium]|jgi:primosomal protein N' (replication factor Y)